MRPRLWRTALLNLLAWSIVLAVAFPLIWMVLTSIKPQSELFHIPPSILPQSVTDALPALPPTAPAISGPNTPVWALTANT